MMWHTSDKIIGNFDPLLFYLFIYHFIHVREIDTMFLCIDFFLYVIIYIYIYISPT